MFERIFFFFFFFQAEDGIRDIGVTGVQTCALPIFYVGTGESNICGSGCVAGVGIYKSTNGGQTWTGPLGGGPTDTGNPLAGKGVGKILIKPGSPNTIYAATTTA